MPIRHAHPVFRQHHGRCPRFDCFRTSCSSQIFKHHQHARPPFCHHLSRLQFPLPGKMGDYIHERLFLHHTSLSLQCIHTFKQRGSLRTFQRIEDGPPQSVIISINYAILRMSHLQPAQKKNQSDAKTYITILFHLQSL